MSECRRKADEPGDDLGREPAWGNNAASYARVSASGQEDGPSLAFQREEIAALADELGLVIESRGVFEDVASGVDPDCSGCVGLQSGDLREEVE